MTFNFLNQIKFWKRCVLLLVIVPVVLFSALLIFIQYNQSDLIQNELASLNKEHKGLVKIGKSTLSIFGNFPDISIKIDEVRIYETKENDAAVIMDVEDIYVGFNLWDIITGNIDIQSLLIEEGVFNIVIHEDNTTNIQNALATETTETTEPVHFHLKKVKLRNIDIHKLDESTQTDIETFIYKAKGGFHKNNEFISGHIDTELELNVIKNSDTTFINQKHFEVHTDLVLNETTGVLEIKPSGVVMEHGDFELAGSLDTKNDMDLDLTIKGTKPNFDMLIAFAPHDIIPVLERYKNAGEIYFNATVNGPISKGNNPAINAKFGANKAYLENTDKARKIDNMGFKGHFTNGENHDVSTMEFSLLDMTATLDEGHFLGSIFVKNFKEPEIDMQVKSNFSLDFMVDFFNLDEVKEATGNVVLTMNFHDIIDLDHPESALNKLNQAYYSELIVEELSLDAIELPAPLENLNMHLVMNGKEASLKQFELLMGESDLSVTGFLSDLPAIIHNIDQPIEAHLDIQSELLNITQLTRFSKKDSIGVDEQIKDLSLGLSFKAIAKDFSESKYLPKGEFFIDSLHAQLKHYPHELHDFHADVLIDDSDLKIVDFTGHIDDSDFHFNGLIHDYGFWMQKELNGDVDLDISLNSQNLRLEDLFSYKSENFVPKDYRHEEFKKLDLHINSSLHYKNSALHSLDLALDKLTTKMKLHPLKFENFRGKFHYENEHVMIQDFHGEIGKTNFTVDLNYYLGKNEAIKKRVNYLKLTANYIDFDELFNFNLKPSTTLTTKKNTTEDVKEHAEAFNLYELPFTDMKFEADISHFIHHKIDLQQIKASIRTTPNHYVYIDTFGMKAAGGSISLSGYFNGSDAKHIYIKPDLEVENVSIEKLLFKFENFGQDHLVSENLEGTLSTRIQGKVRVYPDLVPDLDQSNIQMDVKVLNGELKNYDPMLALSDYMGDKNLRSIRFDTLQNHLDINKGKITIPKMMIESTLGHLEISGTHDSQQNIDYLLRIPWKMVRKAAAQKLFGNKKNSANATNEDEIETYDPNKRTNYLNVKVKGTLDDYKISLGE